MDRRQRKRKQQHRTFHQDQSRTPRLILKRNSYPVVKQGHIVPATYQRNFAQDGFVALHVVGKPQCVRTKVENAGTRSRAYRRTRPDGSEIDDVEASLADFEAVAGPELAQVAQGAEITFRRKAILAQFVAVQMLRTPHFLETTVDGVVEHATRSITEDNATAAGLAMFNGDLEAVRRYAAVKLKAQGFLEMLSGSRKLATTLGCMRWQSLLFEECVLAYSDQPVAVWPMDADEITERPPAPRLGPLTALEVKVPLSANMCLLMSWEDLSDSSHPQNVSPSYAEHINALVIAQADRQWMHHPEHEPPISAATLYPISRALNAHYSAASAFHSARLREANRQFEKGQRRQFANTVKVVTEVGSAKPSRARKRARRS